MRQAKKTKHKVVSVVWKDAHADFGGSWVSATDIATEPCLVHSCGFLLPNAKPDHLTLVQSAINDSIYDHVIHIPNAMVVSVTEH